jgi:hypothetical protein
MTLVIEAFINFECKYPPSAIAESRRLIPTEGDLLLSTLAPFRDSQTTLVKIFDLQTPGGRLRGLLNGVSESPTIIIAGERHVGLVAVNDAIDQILGAVLSEQPVP